MEEQMPEIDEVSFEEDKQSEPNIVENDSGKRRIITTASDPTVKGLYDRYKEGDLLLQPDFQRYFVWDGTKSSRLVESLLLDVPLPIIYLAEEADGGESVIDGQQRLTSLFDFLDGKFALTGLEVRHDLNSHRFADLDKLSQGKIRKAAIRAITFQKDSDEDLKFQIFERLNTGSVALNDQELRNCVYRGDYNRLLRELAEDKDFMYLLGIQQPEKRMRDVELVLRFAAFYHATYLKYRPPVRRFLNEDMKRFQKISPEDADDLRNAFRNSVQIIHSLLGKNAFKRFYRGTEKHPNGYWEQKKFNASLYDIQMYGFTDYSKNQIYPHLDSIREALISLMTEDSDFIRAIEISTSSATSVRTRFDKWRQNLEQIVGSPRTETRCFSRELKKELFERNPTCALCNQAIRDLDDAAVDHIEQYWLGGKTIPENARLAHRFCNGSRPRKE